ncbi:ATP-binding protein [Streptomyces hundungensis]|uniref:ATP-binding protein n=1 Tax=Streptomyces hundungensis TaxID=1077946 RepID=UPI0013C445CE|nr:ATP-binding protein [Streptomyces hundungensis]
MFETDSARHAVPEARRRAVAFVRDTCPGADLIAVQLVLGELISNAVRHTAAGTWHLLLRADETALTMTVTDSSSRLPQPRQADPFDGLGGFGLHIVGRLCDSNTVTVHESGKAVTVSWMLPHRPIA